MQAVSECPGARLVLLIFNLSLSLVLVYYVLSSECNGMIGIFHTSKIYADFADLKMCQIYSYLLILLVNSWHIVRRHLYSRLTDMFFAWVDKAR